MTQEQFDKKFRSSLDRAVENMAGSAEVDVKKFYNMVYFLENLSFFSPVIYGLIKKK